jgi:hypothetical protein
MEYLVDLVDLADGTNQHGDADPANGEQVRQFEPGLLRANTAGVIDFSQA